MVIWAAAATAVTIILILILAAYRRQVKDTCRQLAFLKENKTNMRLTLELPFKDLRHLTDCINDVIDMSREIQKTAHKSEESLKETITNLSHDIRTPLTSLDGYFQLLSQSTSEEERQHYIAVVQSRIRSLKDMLEELFTYTKLQNESYELELSTEDFGKCVFDTVFSFYDEFQRKGLEPEIDFLEGHLPVVGNAEAIGRALQNVVKNALVHGREKISLRLYREEHKVVFICSNHVEEPEKINVSEVFSKFYKADSARGSRSTGLGLSIAKGLIERMDGQMTVSLEADCFTVEIHMPLKG